MGRPLTGSVKQTGAGTWLASVPEARGSRRRVEHTFPTEAQARLWVNSAVAVLRAGGTVLAYDIVTLVADTVESAAAETGLAAVDAGATERGWFATLCEEFHRNEYMISQNALPDSAATTQRQLNKIIIPFFASRWQGPDDVDWETCNEFAQFLAGRRLADGTVVVATNEQIVAQARAYATSTQGNILGLLKRVLDVAVARRIITVNPALPVHAIRPLEGGKRHRRKRSAHGPTLSLSYCKHSVAPNLHLVHQLSMWVQRICGLRVSEAFGIRVGGINRFEDMGWCIIGSQGGKSFRDWDPIGEVIEVADFINRVKTPTSVRVVVFPPSLMVLIDAVIVAYHTDEFGNVDLSVPLLFGPQSMFRGQAGYRSALTGAYASEEAFTSHDLRKRMIHDVAMKIDQISEVKRRVMVGHSAGSDEHGSVYIRDLIDLSEMVKATKHVEDLVQTEVGLLIVPTDKRPQFTRDHPYYSRQERANEVLVRYGIVAEDHRLSAREIGDLIGRSEQSVAQWCRRGLIEAVKVRTPEGFEQWLATREAVENYLATYAGCETVDNAAESLELTYHQLYQLAARLELERRTDESTGRLLISEEAVKEARVELERVDALRSRSMLVSEAASVLRRPRSSLQLWITSGILEVDPETDTIGQKYVTRESIERRAKELSSASAPRGSRRRQLPGR